MFDRESCEIKILVDESGSDTGSAKIIAIL